MTPYESLEDSLKIDRYQLDTELVNQPQNYYEAAKACAMAISRRDGAKDARDRVRAAAYGRVRLKMEEAGAKVTEAMISNEIALDAKVKGAEDDYRKSVEVASLWDVLRESWLQRSYALKDLVQLHVTAYMQRPDSTAGSAAAVRDADYDSNRRRLSDARKARPARVTL